MKRLTHVLLALFAIGIITSCGSKSAKDINMADIKTACDCVDAAVIIFGEIIDVVDESIRIQEAGDLDDRATERLFELREEGNRLARMLNELDEICDEHEDDSEWEACGNHGKLENMIEEVEQKYGLAW